MATCRNPDGAAELQELQGRSSGRLDIVQLDCTDEGSIAEAASQVSGSHRHLDLLLNVAGILHIPGKMSPGWALRLVLMLITAQDDSIHAYYLTCFLSMVCVACLSYNTEQCVQCAETALSRVTADSLLTNFQINAMGPILVSKASFCPALP